MPPNSYTLTLPSFQLVFTYSERLQGYGYQLFLPGSEGWRPVSAPENPLVRGASFDLCPQKITARPDGSWAVSGSRKVLSTDNEVHEYTWTGCLKPDDATGWLEVRLEVDNLYPIVLQMVPPETSTPDHNAPGLFEPEITLDLGLLPPYERGDHVWFKTSLTNPSKWNDEAYGNDFPGTYYYDPYLKLELLMFFDMTAMSWMGFDNIARFLNYRCGFRRRYRPQAAAEVGLYADGFSGTTFPAGKQSFAYWISARPRGEGPEAPTEQEALTLLIQRCLELVPAESRWPAKATSWEDFSLHCARDMSDPLHSWGRNEDLGEFIINYVDGYSPAWDQAMRARGRQLATMVAPCFESALWSVNPLASLLLVETAPEYHDLQARLLAFMQRVLASGKFGFISG